MASLGGMNVTQGCAFPRRTRSRRSTKRPSPSRTRLALQLRLSITAQLDRREIEKSEEQAMSDKKVLVRIRGLAKDYKRGVETVHVLQALDMDIREGEFLALMGPSGSGKSTLLNLIGGLD